MRRTSLLFATFVALALALVPGLALARAGSGGSMGSRGSYTYSAPPSTSTAPYSAAPIQRSMTQQSQPNANPMYQGSGSGFGSGILTGLVGAGLLGMLFGHGFFGFGHFGIGHLFGLIIQIMIVVWLVKFLIRMFNGGQAPSLATGPNIFARGQVPNVGPLPMGGGGGRGQPIEIGPQDYQQFEQLLAGIQAAWSAHDLNGLQAMATPEMVSYFADQLSQQVSRGVRNQVGDIRLLSGDLAQAWTENGRDYATVAMRFSMIDVTTDTAGHVVDGSPSEHVTATEIWTFVRARGGHWLLSAIQQAR